MAGALDRSQLKVFYGRLFPFELLARWTGYGVQQYLERREFACELAIEGSGDVAFKRHMSFSNAEEMRKAFLELVPNRIEIGPVYTHPPKFRDSYATFAAQERELIFDIDMNDYDEVRFCCKKTSICSNCWPLATTAMKVLALTLTESFGFKNLLWVFSGRRGVHCWVADARARTLSTEAREAILEFMTVIRGSQGPLASRVALRFPLHPNLQHVYDQVLLPFFESHYITAQRLFADEASVTELLSFLPAEHREELLKLWDGMHDPLAMWKTLKNFVEKKRASKQGRLFGADPVAAIVFAHTYPRFDANVTKIINHLLKSPFCVHPSTGRISVPIDLATCDEFNPESVPTLTDLLHDIDDFDRDAMVDEQHDPAVTTTDLHKTRLASAVALFERFVATLLVTKP